MVIADGGGVLCSLENTKFWPILAILSQIYTLYGVIFTGPKSAIVFQNCKISGMFVLGILRGS